MRRPTYTTQFERDLRLLQRRGKDIEKLKQVLTTLIDKNRWRNAIATIP